MTEHEMTVTRRDDYPGPLLDNMAVYEVTLADGRMWRWFLAADIPEAFAHQIARDQTLADLRQAARAR